ncbi:MAG: ATP-binding cassette domain-containing protein [Chitinivibrionales bacterium]|nr:ATP-binding cassette domain-containing protein [Chitinivibrionales bacterium]
MHNPTAHLEVDSLTVAYNGSAVLRNVSCEIGEGERWALIGKNGAGKSTLIKAIASLLHACAGRITVKGRIVGAYAAKERARLIAYVPQKPEGSIPFTVNDYVMLGRYARQGVFGLPSADDYAAVKQALALCDVENLMCRTINTLSGGEMQRVLLAGAVAQQTPILLLDEPTTFLDPAHEKLFLEALARVQEQCRQTIVMVTHDINVALSLCTHICALKSGEIYYQGTMEEFADRCPGILTDIFGIAFTRFRNERHGGIAYGTWERA